MRHTSYTRKNRNDFIAVQIDFPTFYGDNSAFGAVYTFIINIFTYVIVFIAFCAINKE